MTACAFVTGLTAATPKLRGFARGLARDRAEADDLVQETLLKAWIARDKFTPGTNLEAWLFTILRNAFYSKRRRLRREVEDVDGAHAARLAVRPTQDHGLRLAEFAAAFARLPAEQREALMLIGGAQVSYEEAAAICGVAVGTIKSRTHRARASLAALLGCAGAEDLFADEAIEGALCAAARAA
jgi:RNA polymerase sigma-70 factor (ECF subfamily)